MIERLNIESFRGLTNLQLNDLKLINIIVGENNSGKTSVLEAIKILEHPFEPVRHLNLSRNRVSSIVLMSGRMSLYDSVLNMFRRTKSGKVPIEIFSQINNVDISLNITAAESSCVIETDNPKHGYDSIGEMVKALDLIYELKIGAEENHLIYSITENQKLFRNSLDKNEIAYSPIKINYITPIDHLVQNYSIRSVVNSIKSGKKEEIINALKIFDNEIEGIEILPTDQLFRKNIIYIIHHTLGMMPLATYGDGLKKAITLIAGAISSKNGVILIDEIENAIHANALDTFFKLFIKICKIYNVQVFATTHSLEAIDSLLKGSSESHNELAVYRIENKKSATKFTGQNVYDIRYIMGNDLR